MKPQLKFAIFTCALALTAVPALAKGMPEGVPSHGNGNPNGHQGGPEYAPPEDVTPGPKAGLPEKAKAYGRRCQDQSHKHVQGKKGTPFSECVTAMARTANNANITGKKACQAMSKKHSKGEKGTAFSRCVQGVNQLRKEQREKEQAQEAS